MKAEAIRIEKEEILKFFDRYEHQFNTALKEGTVDASEVANSFAEHFIEASPDGILAGTNDENYRKMIPKGWSAYRKMGVISMYIIQKEITLLDDLHAIVKIDWRCLYTKNDDQGNIDFVNYYLLHQAEDQLKIFAYITGDEQKALREHGLI